MYVNMFHEDNAKIDARSSMPAAKPRKKYGVFKFVFDLAMVSLTGGLWLIWIFVREMRNN